MRTNRSLSRRGCGVVLWLLGLALVGCGAEERQSETLPAEGAAPPHTQASEAASPTTSAAQTDQAAVLSEDSLSEVATLVIHEYQAAFIGSGTLGKGTLTYQGTQRPFRIGGLGLGGIGVAKVDAFGTVYNMKSLDDFPGTYGNARIGATAADKGAGRLWLKNTNGVVLKLESKLQGLALTAGVDGIVITWESDIQESTRKATEDTQKAWDATKKGTGEVYEKTKQETKGAVGSVKKAFE